MAKIIAELAIGGVVLAIVPAYMQVWNSEGKEKTEQLMSNAGNLFLFSYPILVASLYTVSFELFTLLTTSEYASFYYLLPIIAAGVLLNAATPIFSAGLKLKKQVMTMFWCVFVSTILNLILNLAFIPTYGLTAAAIATTISYSFIIICFAYFGTKTLALSIDKLLFVRSIIYSLIFVYLNCFIKIDSNTMQLLFKMISGVIYFSVICFIFEKKLTTYLLKIFFNKGNRTA